MNPSFARDDQSSSAQNRTVCNFPVLFKYDEGRREAKRVWKMDRKANRTKNGNSIYTANTAQQAMDRRDGFVVNREKDWSSFVVFVVVMCALVARTENFHMQNFPIFVHSASLMDTTHMPSLHLIRTLLSGEQSDFQQPNSQQQTKQHFRATIYRQNYTL